MFTYARGFVMRRVYSSAKQADRRKKMKKSVDQIKKRFGKKTNVVDNTEQLSQRLYVQKRGNTIKFVFDNMLYITKINDKTTKQFLFKGGANKFGNTRFKLHIINDKNGLIRCGEIIENCSIIYLNVCSLAYEFYEGSSYSETRKADGKLSIMTNKNDRFIDLSVQNEVEIDSNKQPPKKKITIGEGFRRLFGIKLKANKNT